MKKFKKFLLFYFSFLFIAVIFSCECIGPTSAEIIGNGTLEVRNSDFSLSDGIETGPFIVRIFPEVEYAENSPLFNLLNSAYASTCDPQFKNFIEGDKLTLSFDKTIVFQGEEIAPGTNILAFDIFNLPTRLLGGETIFFDAEILDDFIFQKTIYLITVQMETSNDLMLESSKSQRFDIN